MKMYCKLVLSVEVHIPEDMDHEEIEHYIQDVLSSEKKAVANYAKAVLPAGLPGECSIQNPRWDIE
jgi:hypothetical protein